MVGEFGSVGARGGGGGAAVACCSLIRETKSRMASPSISVPAAICCIPSCKTSAFRLRAAVMLARWASSFTDWLAFMSSWAFDDKFFCIFARFELIMFAHN